MATTNPIRDCFGRTCFRNHGGRRNAGHPLIVRYITNEVVYLPGNEPLHQILKLGALMLGLVVLEFICNFYIVYQGHIMGASIEHDMRNEIFPIIRSCPLPSSTTRR